MSAGTTRGVPQGVFLQRVRAALAQPGPEVPLPDSVEVARVARAGEDILGLFVARAEDAKMHAIRVPDQAAMVRKVIQLVKSLGARTALLPDEPFAGRKPLATALKRAKISLLDPDDPDVAFTAEVGITAAVCGIAETGSISVESGDGRRRLASLAVPYHIVILRASDIVPDLLDWAEGLSPFRKTSRGGVFEDGDCPSEGRAQKGDSPHFANKREMGTVPANHVLITGPSKTADIELTLVMGVHGPKSVYVIIIEK